MRQITLHIEDKKYPLFVEMVKSLDFVKKIEEDEPAPAREEILAGIKQAVKEMKLVKAGKLNTRPLKEVLDEL